MRNHAPSPVSGLGPSRHRDADRTATPTAQQPRPSLRLAQVVPIDRAARLDLRDGFLQLAALAARGEITGALYSVMGPGGHIRHGALGQAQKNTPLAHYAAAQMVDLLLHLNDSESD